MGMFESSFILTTDKDDVSAAPHNDPPKNGKDASLAFDEVSITEDEDESDDDDDDGSISVENTNDRMRLLSSDLLVAMSTRSTHFSNHPSIQADNVTAEELRVLQEDDDVSLSAAEKQVAVMARRYAVLREVR